MTEQELFEELDVRLEIYEDILFTEEAFFIPDLKTVFLSDQISETDRIKMALHELGHQKHLPHLYSIFREKYESQANRHMIHHLVRSELEQCEDYTTFNYVVFMEKYKLNTLADETMVKEEFYNLANKII